MMDSETRFKIEDTLTNLEAKINKMDCLLYDITNISYDIDKKELEKVYFKINIITDYIQPVRNDINKILKVLYSCDENENAVPNNDQANEELH